MSDATTETLDLTPRHALSLHSLRRLRAGELVGEEQQRAQAHLAGCPTCQARAERLATEDRQVRAALPFDAFAESLARRSAGVAPAPRGRRRLYPVVGLALAAGLAALIASQMISTERRNNTKGGSLLELYVGGLGESRKVAGEPELRPGEGVRLAYDSGGHRYLTVISIDETGKVTPLYPERGQSLTTDEGANVLLPQSVVFDGRGRERLVALFSDAPLEVGQVVEQAQGQFRRAGSLSALGPLGVGGAEEVDRTVVKPGAQ